MFFDVICEKQFYDAKILRCKTFSKVLTFHMEERYYAIQTDANEMSMFRETYHELFPLDERERY